VKTVDSYSLHPSFSSLGSLVGCTLSRQISLDFVLAMDYRFVHVISSPHLLKGGGTLCAGSATALLVFGPVMPKGELALLV
jgi:hypothetical protein